MISSADGLGYLVMYSPLVQDGRMLAVVVAIALLGVSLDWLVRPPARPPGVLERLGLLLRGLNRQRGR